MGAWFSSEVGAIGNLELERKGEKPKADCCESPWKYARDLAYHDMILYRMRTENAKYYTIEDFKQLYGEAKFQAKWDEAPQWLEMREVVPGSDDYGHPEDFYNRYKDQWRAKWERAAREKRLCDDGKWYEIQAFQGYYQNDAQVEQRWNKAPACWEYRYDLESADPNKRYRADYFYERNEAFGKGNKWTLNFKPGWDEASKLSKREIEEKKRKEEQRAKEEAQKERIRNMKSDKRRKDVDEALDCRRLADDGNWYHMKEFTEFYPGYDGEQRWKNAPREHETRKYVGPEYNLNGRAFDAKWFYNKNKEIGGDDWSKNSKPLWEDAEVVGKGNIFGATKH